MTGKSLHVGLLALSVFSLIGCVSWQGQRKPNLVRHASEPSVDHPPVIWVILGWDETTRAVDEYTREFFQASLSRAMGTSAIMQWAWIDQARAPIHYVVFLDASGDTTALTWMLIDGFFVMLFPAKSTESVKVTASLYEASTGRELGAYEAQGERKTLGWLPLLPATPFALAFGPTKDELYDSTFEDIFIQIATELQHRDLPAAADPSRLQIKPPPPVHQRHEIQVL